jgi:hypothetical protein
MSVGGFIVIVAGGIVYFVQSDSLVLSVGIIFAGGLIAQFGTGFQNRFGRSPRADELIDQSIKGISDEYAIFHYYAGTAHALFTPYKAYALIPRYEQGEIWYEDGVWKHQPKAKRSSRRTPREKVLRSIEREVDTEVRRLRRFVTDYLDHLSEIEIEPIIVFVADDVKVNAKNAPFPTVHRKKLKTHLKKEPGQRVIMLEDLAIMKQIFKIK